MLFTLSVDLADGGYFEFSTESIMKFLQAAQMLGNADIEEVEDEEYVYDEDAKCYCWYDEEYEAWYWLDEDTNEWLLVEDEAEDETEAEEVEA
jgi:hypothetical protein